MYNCTVTSTTPGLDTASEYLSKPGYFGRPWQANTSEVVFYKTIVETTDFPGSEGKSLIEPDAWKSSLGGESPKMYEYGTEEKSGEDNSSKRASWATRLETPYIDDGETEITVKAFLGDWADELNERGLLIEETEKAPVEFEDNGVKVTAPEGAFENPDDITFNADPIENETNDKQSAFDLSFTDKDGSKVQPAVSVTVKMPVPEKFAGKTIYVYHVDGDNKYTEIEFKIEDGMAVFTASEFSKYIITSEKYSAPSESDPSDPGTNDPNTPNPPTGVGAGAAIALAIAAGSVIIVCKKKRK